MNCAASLLTVPLLRAQIQLSLALRAALVFVPTSVGLWAWLRSAEDPPMPQVEEG